MERHDKKMEGYANTIAALQEQIKAKQALIDQVSIVGNFTSNPQQWSHPPHISIWSYFHYSVRNLAHYAAQYSAQVGSKLGWLGCWIIGVDEYKNGVIITQIFIQTIWKMQEPSRQILEQAH